MRALTIILVALGLAVPAGGAAPPEPYLDVTRDSPLTIRGVAFKKFERVVVRVRDADTAAKRWVTATRTGSFTVVFRTFHYNVCNSLTVEADGARGSGASLQIDTMASCPIPQPPDR